MCKYKMKIKRHKDKTCKCMLTLEVKIHTFHYKKSRGGG